MSLQILSELPLPGYISRAIYWASGIAIATVILRSYRNSKLDHIPTVGSSTWLGSLWAGITYFSNARDLVIEGYDKYKGGPFKVSTFYYWMVVVSGRKYVEELNKSRDTELNFLEGVNMALKTEHTLGHDVFFNPYHARILRTNLNRNLAAVYADIKDEVVVAFDELLNLDGHEWKSIPARDTILKVVCRATTRIFVGLPLCRDPDWIDLNIRFTLDVAFGGVTVGFFPEFMASFVVRYLTTIPSSLRRGTRLLSPVIEARWKHVEECGGSWADSPNDFLSWLMQEVDESQRGTENLVMRVLAIGFAAIHNTAHHFTQVLYDLAANPQYIQPLREEVEAIVKEEGWSKASVAKMYKVDSFIKETTRLQTNTFVNMARKSMKDVTFSDGTFIPKGTYLVIASQPMHFDEEYYDNSLEFDPFRFSKMRAADGVSATKHGFSTTSPEYLAFGHGRHACPGRFFASDELLTLLAYVVLTYDVKLADNAPRPPNSVIGCSVNANTSARVMFRKRVV